MSIQLSTGDLNCCAIGPPGSKHAICNYEYSLGAYCTS